MLQTVTCVRTCVCFYECTSFWLAGAVNKNFHSEFEGDGGHLFFLQEIRTEMFSV